MKENIKELNEDIKEVSELINKIKSKNIEITSYNIKKIFRSFILGDGYFWKICGRAEIPFNKFIKILEIIEKEGFIKVENKRIVLTEKGNKLVESLYLKNTPVSVVCSKCEGTGIVLDDKFKDILKEYTSLVKNRPKPISDYDQGYLTPLSAVKRLAFMCLENDIEGKDILIIGDDDLMGLLIGLTGLANRIVVMEIDERIVKFLKDFSKSKNIKNLEIIGHDLRKPLPNEILGKFDTFITDPPETKSGAEVFIKRGLQGLKEKEGLAGYFGVTLIEASLEKWRIIQEIILGCKGIVITDIMRYFSFYENFEYVYDFMDIPDNLKEVIETDPQDWYNSALYKIITLKDFTHPNLGSLENIDILLDEECIINYPRKK